MQYVKLLPGLLLILLAASCEDGSLSVDNGPSDNDQNNTTDSAEELLADSTIGCNSREEQQLIKEIREYRDEKGLAEIPVSQALTKVADIHVRDMIQNKPRENMWGDCNLHSWSDSGSWSSCCYTPDHDKAECMWDKPRELTDYEGNGYEIAAAGTDAEGLLALWKDSKAHNDVIINQGDWKDIQWQAMGVSIKGGYGVVWFGEKTDEKGEPEECK